jgi:acetolactate synthase-1/2/3 large subunit
MALSAARIRVPANQKNFVRCRSTSAIAGSSIVDAKSRVREHARHISRSTAAKATAAPAMYVDFARNFNVVDVHLTPV